jgi:hypothetical protein
MHYAVFSGKQYKLPKQKKRKMLVMKRGILQRGSQKNNYWGITNAVLKFLKGEKLKVKISTMTIVNSHLKHLPQMSPKGLQLKLQRPMIC